MRNTSILYNKIISAKSARIHLGEKFPRCEDQENNTSHSAEGNTIQYSNIWYYMILSRMTTLENLHNYNALQAEKHLMKFVLSLDKQNVSSKKKIKPPLMMLSNIIETIVNNKNYP